MSFSSGGSRYGGFGSESLGYGGGGSYSGGGGGSSRGEYATYAEDIDDGSYVLDYDSYGDGGSAGGSGGFSGGFRDSSSRRQFQEYDAGDDDAIPRRSNSVSVTGSSAAAAPQRSSTLPTSPAPEPKGKQPEIDLLGMDDDAFGSAPSAPADKALPALGAQPVSLGQYHSRDVVNARLTLFRRRFR